MAHQIGIVLEYIKKTITKMCSIPLDRTLFLVALAHDHDIVMDINLVVLVDTT